MDTAGAGNAVRGNRVHSNLGLGIDLNNDDIPTANDDLDADSLQNYPILTSANTDTTNGIVFVAGRIESAPSSTFYIDLFANSTIDPSGYGEGETYLGEALVFTDANGIGHFDGLYVAAVPVGGWITATATDSSGNTSEFSLNIQADDMGTLTVDTTADVVDGNTSSITNLLVDRGADDRISLREAIEAANNTANFDVATPDEIRFNLGPHDTGHVFYADDGVVGQVTTTNIATTTEADDAAIIGIDPDFDRSWWSIQSPLRCRRCSLTTQSSLPDRLNTVLSIRRSSNWMDQLLEPSMDCN